MEWIKKMGLKKSLFTITLINTVIALLLSALVFWAFVELGAKVAPNGVVIDPHSNPITMTAIPEPSEKALQIADILSVLQVIVPVLIFVTALFITAYLFYRIKLKMPLELLSDGASRIIAGDLDFSINPASGDELGQLCTAFEIMRQSLLKNNQELWQQAEERKRLNAAFSHDLRNPITVLKGSAKMTKQYALALQDKSEPLTEHLERIEGYTTRIERYVETMSSVQRLEEIQPKADAIDYCVLAEELETAIRFVVLDDGKELSFSRKGREGVLRIDKGMFFQIAENLVSNALRYASRRISVELMLDQDCLTLIVADDGCGFSKALLQNGIKPFQKDSRQENHLGMGLYICNLLCQKHGGCLTLKNHATGACVEAIIKIR